VFDQNGVLPPFMGNDASTPDRSPYAASIVEFVTHFGTSPHRRQLLKKFIAYRQLLTADGYVSGYQFVDGSFVEDVERTQRRDPIDIDVFSFLDAPIKYQTDPSAWALTGFQFWQGEIINRDLNKVRFSLDTYALLLQETNLPSLIQGVIYWNGLFSHQRSTYAWKGFVAVALDSVADQAALATLESV